MFSAGLASSSTEEEDDDTVDVDVAVSKIIGIKLSDFMEKLS